MASAGLLFTPILKKTEKGAELKDRLDNVIAYRSGWKKQKKKPGGHEFCYLANRGAESDFNFGEFTDEEPERTATLAKLFGGEYLLLWTYGHAVTVLQISNDTPGEEPRVREMTFRLQKPESGRKKELFDEFRSWFQGSIKPDFDVLVRELQSPEVSVAAWFEAFGLEGARELAGEEPGALWQAFDEVAVSLLTGEPADVAQVKLLNKEICTYEEDAALKAKPSKQKGVNSRKISEAFAVLEEVIGEPQQEPWSERKRAASFYWDISDCDGSLERLTFGVDKQGVGVSGAIGRLMLHYPTELRRDAVMWSLAAFQAENANGHAYVEGFEVLAESIHDAGFTLVIAPEKSLGTLRKASGLGPEKRTEQYEDEWCAELFVDLPKLQKKSPLEVLEKWFASKQQNGLLLRADKDGNITFSFFENGENSDYKVCCKKDPSKSLSKLQKCAATFDIEQLLSELGFSGLLDPGEWQEGAYAGCSAEASNGEESEERREARKAAERAPKPLTVPDYRYVLHPATEELHQDTSLFKNKRFVTKFRITVPGVSEDWLLTLRKDLQQKGVVENYGEVWNEGDTVWGFSRSKIRAAIWLRALGDAPNGSEICIETSEHGLQNYSIDFSAEPPTVREWQETLLAWQGDVEAESESEVTCDESDADDDDDDDEYAEMEREMEFSSALDEGLKDETLISEVLLEKDDRKYFALDLTPLALLMRADLPDLETKFYEASFIRLGDLYAEQLGDAIYRGFLKDDAVTFGSITIMKFGPPAIELYTSFEKSYSITTTTNQWMKSREDAGAIFQVLPENASIEELMAAHKQAVAQVDAQYGSPRTFDKSAAGYAEAIEEFFTRYYNV